MSQRYIPENSHRDDFTKNPNNIIANAIPAVNNAKAPVLNIGINAYDDLLFSNRTSNENVSSSGQNFQFSYNPFNSLLSTLAAQSYCNMLNYSQLPYLNPSLLILSQPQYNQLAYNPSQQNSSLQQRIAAVLPALQLFATNPVPNSVSNASTATLLNEMVGVPPFRQQLAVMMNVIVQHAGMTSWAIEHALKVAIAENIPLPPLPQEMITLLDKYRFYQLSYDMQKNSLLQQKNLTADSSVVFTNSSDSQLNPVVTTTTVPATAVMTNVP